MEPLELMREEVKKYIETADEKVVKMVHAMLEVDADEYWWDRMSDNIKENSQQTVIKVSNAQINMLLKSEEDIHNGNVVSDEYLNDEEDQWLKG